MGLADSRNIPEDKTPMKVLYETVNAYNNMDLNANSEIEINSSGYYQINFTTSIDIGGTTSTSLRFTNKSYLMKYDANPTPANTKISGSTCYIYNRTATEGEGSGSNSCIVYLVAGNKITTYVERQFISTGSTSLNLINDACSITVLKL